MPVQSAADKSREVVNNILQDPPVSKEEAAAAVSVQASANNGRPPANSAASRLQVIGSRVLLIAIVYPCLRCSVASYELLFPMDLFVVGF